MTYIRFIVGCMLAATACIFLPLRAQTQEVVTGDLPIATITDGQHGHATVTILGTFGAEIDSPAGLYRYNFADRHGKEIEVHSIKRFPIVGVSGFVRGEVIPPVDTTTPGFIQEHDPGRIEPETGERINWDGTRIGVVPNPQPGEHPTQPLSPLVIAMMTATGLVLVALLVVLVMVLTGGSRGAQQTVVAEGHTIKMQVGTPEAIKKGTVKVLPGRFEVTEGDDTMREIRLFSTAENPGKEFLLARVDNGAIPPPNTVGFKHESVSRNQGKLICSGEGIYTVINYANPTTKNPIIINSRPLSEGESAVLSDGDALVIGTVRLKYHAT